ncbi:MAG TPA: hypothetical protein VF896_16045 [Anaerolineales bacterium]
MRVFRKKFPPLREILGLYATIVCLVYSWTSIAFFWKVPSWLYFLTLGEIAVVLSYLLVSSLLEATIILFIFLLASLTLPSRWLSDKFLVRGSVIIYSLTFWVALFDLSSLIELPSSSTVISFMIGMPLTCALAIMLVDRISLVHQAITSLGDRLTIFLYVCLPLSLIGIFVIILRIL